jgi:hypothetical protein
MAERRESKQQEGRKVEMSCEDGNACVESTAHKTETETHKATEKMLKEQKRIN